MRASCARKACRNQIGAGSGGFSERKERGAVSRPLIRNEFDQKVIFPTNPIVLALLEKTDFGLLKFGSPGFT